MSATSDNWANYPSPSLAAFRTEPRPSSGDRRQRENIHSLQSTAEDSSSSNEQAVKRKQIRANNTQSSNIVASTSPACIPKPAFARKQIISTHVESDDEVDGGETVVTISCDNEDCKALLLENKSLRDKLKKLQRRLDIAGKKFWKTYSSC